MRELRAFQLWLWGNVLEIRIWWHRRVLREPTPSFKMRMAVQRWNVQVDRWKGSS